MSTSDAVTSSVYGRGDFRDLQTDEAPPELAQYNDSDLPPAQVLLIADILVGGQKQFESRLFGGLEEVSVLQGCPPALPGFYHAVANQRTDQAARRIVIQ